MSEGMKNAAMLIAAIVLLAVMIIFSFTGWKIYQAATSIENTVTGIPSATAEKVSKGLQTENLREPIIPDLESIVWSEAQELRNLQVSEVTLSIGHAEKRYYSEGITGCSEYIHLRGGVWRATAHVDAAQDISQTRFGDGIVLELNVPEVTWSGNPEVVQNPTATNEDVCISRRVGRLFGDATSSSEAEDELLDFVRGQFDNHNQLFDTGACSAQNYYTDLAESIGQEIGLDLMTYSSRPLLEGQFMVNVVSYDGTVNDCEPDVDRNISDTVANHQLTEVHQ